MAVRLERSDAIATIVIDRPQARNAVDDPAARALAEAFREFERQRAAGGRAPGGRRRWAVPLIDGGTVRLPRRAREEAEALARAIAAFPPRCGRSDRRSAWDGLGLPLPEALDREFALDKATHDSGESRDGARRFAAGAGQHGQF